MKVGLGYDVHPLVKGRKLILGGVEIPFSKGLAGHSDGDALIHAIIDALFGAASLGDIGSHFSDKNENYKNISSLYLLDKTAKIISELHYKIINIDSVIVLENPKINDYINDMKKKISQKLNINSEKISIKATREEGLGFVGQGKGIKVYAIALIEKNN